MKKPLLAIDFETISTKSLKDCGSYRYLKDSSTKITLMSICDVHEEDINDEDKILSHCKVIEVYKYWDTGVKITSFFPYNDNYNLLVHNRDFELHSYFNGYQLKSILPKDCTVYDTMLLARRLSLPNSLDKLSSLFGIHKKNTRLLNKFSVGLNEDEFYKMLKHPDYEEFKRYCLYDTVSTVNSFLNIKRLFPEIFEPSFEDEVLKTSDKINDIGIPIDISSVDTAQKLLEKLSEEKNRECLKKFGFLPTQVLKIKNYINSHSDIKIESSDRKALEEFISVSDDENLKELASIRLASSSSSIKKLNKMKLAEVDGRVHGVFQYHKAHTGRWSASLIQPQNMPRGLQKEGFFENLYKTSTISEEEVKNNLRGFIKAPNGFTFVIADYRQIEFRLLLYQAKDLTNIQKVKEGVDLYKELASSIYDVPIEKVTKDQRQVGKIVTLGSGYGLGSVGLERILKQYGIEGIDTKKAIQSFRKKYSKIVDFWSVLDNDSFCRIKYFSKGENYLSLSLPSGRRIYYHNPKRVLEDSGIESWKFYNGEETEFFYGGKFVENFIQGMSRDLLAVALVRLDRLGFNPVLHVHDEIVIEINKNNTQQKKELIRLAMVKPPLWFDSRFSFLLDLEIALVDRYTK